MSGNYHELADDELVEIIQKGDRDAFAGLSARYLWLIRLKASGFGGAHVPEREDLLQEGFLALYDAACTYKKSGGTPFKAYAGVCVENRMITAVRRYSSGKNRPLNESVSLDVADMAGSPADSPEREVEGRESLQEMMEQMQLALTPLERRALSLYLCGCPRSQVQKRAGIQLRVYDNAMRRVRKKIKEL